MSVTGNDNRDRLERSFSGGERFSELRAGLPGVAFGAMLHREATGGDRDLVRERPHLPAKAKSVIWFFMNGGTSHLESFDPKPALNKYAGMTIDESPAGKAVTESPFYRKNVRDFGGKPRSMMPQLYPLQVGLVPAGKADYKSANGGRILDPASTTLH
ncbi:MAG: DUF1501 domain-containing protein [Pirellulaceae bacterium]